MGFPKESIMLATNGEQALNNITEDVTSQEPSKELISLMIVDYNIPIINGQEVLKKAKKMYSENEKNFPKVLMLTAIEDERLSKRCFSEKIVNAFMLKPAEN